MIKDYRVKVYTVEISKVDPECKRWYHTRQGQWFNCILVSKPSEGRIMPVFIVVGSATRGFPIEVNFKTIRLIDCTVVYERVVENSGLCSFCKSYTNQSVYEEAR